MKLATILLTTFSCLALGQSDSQTVVKNVPLHQLLGVLKQPAERFFKYQQPKDGKLEGTAVFKKKSPQTCANQDCEPVSLLSWICKSLGGCTTCDYIDFKEDWQTNFTCTLQQDAQKAAAAKKAFIENSRRCQFKFNDAYNTCSADPQDKWCYNWSRLEFGNCMNNPAVVAPASDKSASAWRTVFLAASEPTLV